MLTQCHILKVNKRHQNIFVPLYLCTKEIMNSSFKLSASLYVDFGTALGTLLEHILEHTLKHCRLFSKSCDGLEPRK